MGQGHKTTNALYRFRWNDLRNCMCWKGEAIGEVLLCLLSTYGIMVKQKIFVENFVFDLKKINLDMDLYQNCDYIW